MYLQKVISRKMFLKNQYFVGVSVADPDPNPDPSDPYVLSLLDPDPNPLVGGMDPDPATDPDPSITKQKNSKKNLDAYCFMTFYL